MLRVTSNHWWWKTVASVCRLAISFSACCSAGWLCSVHICGLITFEFTDECECIPTTGCDPLEFRRCYSYQSCRRWPISDSIYSLQNTNVLWSWGMFHATFMQIKSFDLGKTRNYLRNYGLLLLSNIVEEYMVVASTGTCHGRKNRGFPQKTFEKHSMWIFI